MSLWRLIGVVFAMWAGAAQAAAPPVGMPMVTTFATWMRVGPSPWAKEIDEIPAGWPVTVLTCADGWCSVVNDGASGYVAQTMLAAGRDTPTEPVPGAACFPGTHQTPERAIPLKICPAEVRTR